MHNLGGSTAFGRSRQIIAGLKKEGGEDEKANYSLGRGAAICGPGSDRPDGDYLRHRVRRVRNDRRIGRRSYLRVGFDALGNIFGRPRPFGPLPGARQAAGASDGAETPRAGSTA
ncbi:MAG: hypothetical protein UT11_C0028G0012 [Berkelbacteria bacterium GW2011_GWA2_38_9]|uniref:Uncharacterized protein n=1 Tax=Berkelbacteria bacterium GW2011_GWA2_38_9 TaxID=1618334 RepID=A0A0G0LE69_9BACT|nr:MAG: hypothetical protein UT11_C0028G0012 [Berkelbacteria bacterium GW2011_GWA2_38_9]